MLQDWFENNQYVDNIDCYMLCQNIKFPVAWLNLIKLWDQAFISSIIKGTETSWPNILTKKFWDAIFSHQCVTSQRKTSLWKYF